MKTLKLARLPARHAAGDEAGCMSSSHSVDSEARVNVSASHARLISAMRALHIRAPQDAGLWAIERRPIHPSILAQGLFDAYPDVDRVMTTLHRWTDATLYLGQGEAVMSDDPRELRRHLPILFAARGRILISGLGLGCVVRGLLTNPRVTHIDVVEVSRDVLTMVEPYFRGERRVAIHEGDALTIPWPSGTTWDFAWHDVWSETPGTQVVHAQLVLRYRRMVTAGQQGAWMFPREFKRRVTLIDSPRKARA